MRVPHGSLDSAEYVLDQAAALTLHFRVGPIAVGLSIDHCLIDPALYGPPALASRALLPQGATSTG